MLHQLLERAGLDGRLAGAYERTGAIALGMLLLDAFIAHGPLSGTLLRLFGQDQQHKKQTRRFLSQLAAKLVGIIFLAAVFPPAFQCLGDLELSAGHRFSHTTPTSQRMVEVCAGYFLYDIVICIFKFADNGWEFFIHAVVCSSVFCVAAFKGLVHYYGAAFLMWELSTPFMYIRWLLLKAGYGSSPVMLYVNLAFMLVFFGCRNVWGPIMTFNFWQESGNQLLSATPLLPPAAIWVIRVMCLALNCLNAYWFAQMVRIAIKGGKPKTKAV